MARSRMSYFRDSPFSPSTVISSGLETVVVIMVGVAIVVGVALTKVDEGLLLAKVCT